MKLLTISNLYPRPDRPQFGLFNAQLFREMSALLRERSGADSTPLRNVCLVPEWRLWRWPAIRRWQPPITDGPPTAYVPVFYLPGVGRNWSAATYSWSRGSLLAAARAADAIYSSWLYPDGVVAARLGALAMRPAWLMALGTDADHLAHPRRGNMIRQATVQSAGVVCVSRQLAVRLAEMGLPADRLHAIPNGVDGSRFHFRSSDESAALLRDEATAAERAALEARDRGMRLILFVGNLVPVKDPGLLIQAMARLRERLPVGHPGVRLLTIGGGPLASALAEQARRLRVTDIVYMARSLPHGRVALWMNTADVLCLCSRSEGMPNVVLEALASGLPVVCTDVGACRELVASAPGCRVTPPGQAVGLADALEGVLNETLNRRALAAGQGTRSWRDQAGEIIELIAGGMPATHRVR